MKIIVGKVDLAPQNPSDNNFDLKLSVRSLQSSARGIPPSEIDSESNSDYLNGSVIIQ